MSLNRHNPKRDANESVMTDYLDDLMYPWFPLSQAGIPDLLVLVHGDWRLIEVKTEQGRLTPDQKEFFELARDFPR